MACRGVSFALSSEELSRLLAAETDADRIGIVQEEIEEKWDEDHLCQLDKAWEAIHRCLTDGTLNPGKPPLSLAILGGRSLYGGSDYIMRLVTADQLPGLVEAVQQIDRRDMRHRYDAMVGYEAPQGDEDFEYTWEYFTGLVEFLVRAHRETRAVLFTADQ